MRRGGPTRGPYFQIFLPCFMAPRGQFPVNEEGSLPTPTPQSPPSKTEAAGGGGGENVPLPRLVASGRWTSEAVSPTSLNNPNHCPGFTRKEPGGVERQNSEVLLNKDAGPPSLRTY